MNKNNKKAFTLIELIIVIIILWILSNIAILNMTNIFSDSRNASRISDISVITIWLETHKTKNWFLPTPWNKQDITNSWVIINQWFFDKDISILEITNIPKDPLVKNYYNYSTTQNKLFYQLWTSMEIEQTDIWFKSYINWNYKQIHKNIPSLIIANIWNTNFDLNLNSWAFIVHNSTLNIPYLQDWIAYSSSTDLNEITEEIWVEIPKYAWFKNCEEIIENDRYMWPWDYYWSWVINCSD